ATYETQYTHEKPYARIAQKIFWQTKPRAQKTLCRYTSSTTTRFGLRIFWFGFLGWGCVLVFCFLVLFVLFSLVYFFLFLFFLFLFFFFLFLSSLFFFFVFFFLCSPLPLSSGFVLSSFLSLFSLVVDVYACAPLPLHTGMGLSMLGFSLLTLLVECAWCHLPAKLLSVIVTLW